MIKELFMLILSFIISLTSIYTEGVLKPEAKENPVQVFSQGITAREIATTYPYTYEDMVLDIAYLEAKYPDFIEVDTIGSSEWGYPLWTIVLGKRGESGSNQCCSSWKGIRYRPFDNENGKLLCSTL